MLRYWFFTRSYGCAGRVSMRRGKLPAWRWPDGNVRANAASCWLAAGRAPRCLLAAWAEAEICVLVRFAGVASSGFPASAAFANPWGSAKAAAFRDPICGFSPKRTDLKPLGECCWIGSFPNYENTRSTTCCDPAPKGWIPYAPPISLRNRKTPSDRCFSANLAHLVLGFGYLAEFVRQNRPARRVPGGVAG